MSYFGGKGQEGVWQTIINQMPPHDIYIEPFLGGGAVMLHKRPALRNIGIDLDRSALDAFSISSRHLCLPQLEVIHADGIDWLETHGPFFLMGYFIYCDPPYPHSTRTSHTRYQYELDDAAHRELLTLLKQCRGMVAISSYPNPIYDEMLANWRKLDYTSVARSGEVRIERLYMNYLEPVFLHDDRFIGADAGNRQDINRRIARTVKRLRAWPKRERVKMLRQLLADLPEDEIAHLQHR